MENIYYIYFFIVVFNITICNSANILAILPMPSPSHGICNNAILEELASKGHKITALTANPKESTNNITYINIENSYDETEDENMFIVPKLTSFEISYYIGHEWVIHSCEKQSKSNGFKQLITIKKQFDVILFETSGTECFYGFLQQFNAPVVAISAWGCYSWSCTALGGYYPLSVYPDQFVSYTDGEMTFIERIHNILLVCYANIIRYFKNIPIQYKLAKYTFGENLLPLQEIEDKYFKIILFNSGPAGVDANVVLPPSVVEVGCVHCRSAKPLLKNIYEYLDSAKEGAIFFSLGSYLRNDKMDPYIFNILVKTFVSLPYKILWKWESEIPNKPDNVKISKWLPQQDILAHPNIKLFISHGGKLSSQESIYHGVPMLAIPILLDQYGNANRIKNLGIGEIINYNEFNENDFSKLIKKLMMNSNYTNKAKVASILMQDQPQTPLERAIFWIEYVIRHGHKTNLKASTTKLPWYQLLYLDIIAFVLVMCIIIRCTVVRVVKSISTDKVKIR